MKNKILVFIISFFVLSPSEMMGLNRLWRSLSYHKLDRLDDSVERPATVIGTYKDPEFVVSRELKLLDDLAKEYCITKIKLENRSSAKCNLRLFFENPQHCLNYRKLKDNECIKFLKRDFKHRILFSAESNGNLIDHISYKIKAINQSDNFKLSIILKSSFTEEIVDINIRFCFSTAFDFVLYGFNDVYACGNVIGFKLKAEELNCFDYSALNIKYLFYNREILI